MTPVDMIMELWDTGDADDLAIAEELRLHWPVRLTIIEILLTVHPVHSIIYL